MFTMMVKGGIFDGIKCNEIWASESLSRFQKPHNTLLQVCSESTSVGIGTWARANLFWGFFIQHLDPVIGPDSHDMLSGSSLM